MEECHARHSRFNVGGNDMKLTALKLSVMALATAILILSGGVSPATAHSGGTDKYGCHYNHKTGEYHCHNPKR